MNCKKYLIWIFIGLIAFFPQNIFAQERSFSAQVSAKKVGVNDIFQLTFVLKNAPRNTQYQPPALDDFYVRQGPFQSQREDEITINGVTEVSSTVEVSYVLQAKKTGKIKIDPLEIIIDNKHYFTNAVNIEVVKGSVAQNQKQQQRRTDPFVEEVDPFNSQKQNQRMQQLWQQMQQIQQLMGGGGEPDFGMEPRRQQDLSDFDQKNLDKNLFIRVEVDKRKPFVGEQITATYKLYSRLSINMQLTQLPILNGFWAEDFRIGNPSVPTIEHVNGRPYNVFTLKKSALFPQQAGKLILDPAKAEGVVEVLEGNRPTDLKTSVLSAPLTIEVQPLPTKNQAKSFTGAVGEFSISAYLDSNIISTDNGGNLHFVIRGIGNLKLITAPNTLFPDELSVSDPQIKDTILQRMPDIAGERSFNYFLSPQKAGVFEIPAFEFSYYSLAQQEYVTLKTNPIKLKVIQGQSNAALISEIPEDIHPIINSKLPVAKSSFNLLTQAWYWSLYLLVIIVFAVLVFLSSKQRKEQNHTAEVKHKRANKIAWKRLESARKLLTAPDHTSFYEEVSKAVWLYLSDKLGLPLSLLSKENIAEKLEEKEVNSATLEKVNQLLSECEMALYSPSGALQQKQHTLDLANNLIEILENELKRK